VFVGRVRNIPFTVLGVLSKKGQSPYGQDLDDVVLIPTTTFRSKIQQSLGNSLQGSIFVEATDAAAVARAERNISGLLRDRHHLSPAAEDDFQLRNLAEAASAQEEGTRTLTALLASIAAVSLLVGGIGIMNIMLVSVTERTREIGIRMALGATPANVMLQFLVESLALSVAGGLLGIALGIGGAFILAAKMGWPVVVNPSVIGLSVGFSAIVGIGFGLYPAYKASQLDPIVALRWE
jgi:putative ABC transport system permease protein